jgi:hypothetical protein
MKKEQAENAGVLILIEMKKMLPEKIKLKSIRADNLLHAQQLIVQLLLFVCDAEKYTVRTIVTDSDELLFYLCFNGRKQKIKLCYQNSGSHAFQSAGKMISVQHG